jgi:hypothetical protein
MKRKPPRWEEPSSGVRVLRLYQTELNPDWPRILILELTTDRFREFEQDSLAFDKKHKLFPDSPISWISTCAKPPQVKGVRPPPDSASWTVVILKGPGTRAASTAFPHDSS